MADPSGSRTGERRRVPLEERMYYALRDAGLDESEAEQATKVVLPLGVEHGHSEYERGIEYGRFLTERTIVQRLGFHFSLEVPGRG
jgi:hypothetical protein